MKRVIAVMLAALLALGMIGTLAERVPEEKKGETLELEAAGAETEVEAGDEVGELDLLSLEGETVSLSEAGPEGGAPEAAEANDDDIAIDEEYFPDAVFREYVRENFDADGDGKLSADECLGVNTIDVSQKDIKSLKGIEYFTNLTYLKCSNNKLTQLVVSKNKELDMLFTYNNAIKSIDIKNSPDLRKALSEYKKKTTKKYVKWLHKSEFSSLIYGVYIDASTTLTNGKKILYKGK